MGERNNKWRKRLDKYCGCPLLFTLGLFHHKKKISAPRNGASFVILKTAGMGDTIITDAVIHEIKAAYPDSSITFISSKANYGMAKTLEHIDRVYNFEMGKPLKSLKECANLGHFDYCLDFAPWARINAVISYVLNADYKVGFKRKGMYRHYIYDKAVEHSDELHEVDNFRNILKAIGVPLHSYNPEFHPEKSDFISKPYIVFHLFPAGSCVLLRKWADENWIVLGQKIYEKYGCRIVLSGGKEDTAPAEQVVSVLKEKGVDVENIAGKYNLRQMIDILGGARLLVSVNTGIMHMGAAVGVPMVALHGATSVKRWGPLSDKAVNVLSRESCQPCISLGFESNCKDPVCMRHITAISLT